MIRRPVEAAFPTSHTLPHGRPPALRRGAFVLSTAVGAGEGMGRGGKGGGGGGGGGLFPGLGGGRRWGGVRRGSEGLGGGGWGGCRGRTGGVMRVWRGRCDAGGAVGALGGLPDPGTFGRGS